MRRFKFRFEPLLFKRQTLVEQAQQELGKQRQILEQYQQQLQDTFDELRRTRLDASQGPLTPHKLQIHNNYRRRLEDLVDQFRKQVREQSKVVDNAKKKLLQLHMDKEVVERLKERERVSYLKEMSQQEMKQLDEFGSIRFNGKKAARSEGN